MHSRRCTTHSDEHAKQRPAPTRGAGRRGIAESVPGGARRDWLTGHRRSGRRRTGRLTFTAGRTAHGGQRREWSTRRYRRSDRSDRHRWSQRRNHRWYQRGDDRRNQRRGNYRRRQWRPGEGHRYACHLGDWSARGCCASYGSCGSCGNRTGLTCRRLQAFVAASCRNAGAQRNSDATQPPDSNYFEVESIKDRHRPSTPSFAL